MLPVFIMAIEDDSDRQFAAELYHSYHSIMHQKALSILKKEDLAEDAVQDAMLKIICHLDKIREIPKREIPFYLIAITQTTCIDRYRKIQREKQACVMGYPHISFHYRLRANCSCKTYFCLQSIQ